MNQKISTDIIFFILIPFCLFLFGSLINFSASYYINENIFVKSFIFILLGSLISLFIFWFIFFNNSLKKQIFRFYLINSSFLIISIILSILIFILPDSLMPTINGAKRWIKTPFFNIAVVEIIKISFVFIFSHIFSSNKFLKNMNTHKISFFKPILLLFLILLLVVTVKQKDFGNFFLFCVVFITMVFLFFNKIRLVFKILSLSLVGFFLLIITSPHRIDRVLGWFKEDSLNGNYQVEQGLHAIHEGSFFGIGAGNSIFKLGYIPEVHTDMIFSLLINEFGLFGLSLYFFLVFYFLIFLVILSLKLNNLYLINYTLISSLLIGYQIFINLFGILGIIPLKGINVPFLSYGGSSTISLFILISLNISLFYIIKNKKEN